MASSVMALIASAFFASLERCSCINLGTSENDAGDGDDDVDDSAAAVESQPQV